MEVLVRMKINWGMIGLGLLSIVFWYSIFTKGFLSTMIWVIVLSCLIGIYFKLKEDMII